MAALTPTYYTVQAVSGIGMGQGDVHKAIFNLWKAVKAICYNLDDDTGAPGVDYMDNIGTDLDTAMAKWKTPTSGDPV